MICKRITRYLLPRSTWFILWFRAWFKNPEGIKGFADKIMNGLMQRTLPLAARLKKENKRLEEENKKLAALSKDCRMHPLVGADEYDEVRGKLKKLHFWIIFIICAEAALNYFGVEAVILQQGWLWIIFKAFIAVMLIGLGFLIFEKWLVIAFHRPKYKQIQTKSRNWPEFAALTIMCIAYEVSIYYLCRIRGIALEGANGDSFVTYFVVLAGMILPVVLGYCAYERSLYLSPYGNTLRIAKAESKAAANNSKIAMSKQTMEQHFKQELQGSWALMQEFKVYKENYNIKHQIPKEKLTGHYCENHDSFEKEGAQRYSKEVLHKEP